VVVAARLAPLVVHDICVTYIASLALSVAARVSDGARVSLVMNSEFMNACYAAMLSLNE